MILVTTVATLAMSAVTASGAQADTYSCAFTGSMDIVPADTTDFDGTPADSGVESVSNDAGWGAGWTNGGPMVLDDFDDGRYRFTTWIPTFVSQVRPGLTCLYTNENGGPGDSGIYTGWMDSRGDYRSWVCGTGIFADGATGYFPDYFTGADRETEVVFEPLPNGATASDVTEVDYTLQFQSGHSEIGISSLENAAGESSHGWQLNGYATVAPVTGNCVTMDAAEFRISGAFTRTTQ